MSFAPAEVKKIIEERAMTLLTVIVKNTTKFQSSSSDVFRQRLADEIEGCERELVELALSEAGLHVPLIGEWRHVDQVRSYGSRASRERFRALYPDMAWLLKPET
jgi:hypothetical protein